MSGRISFIGAGPGAADLITVRGAGRIAEADVVVWSASLVSPECIREHARTEAELVDSSRLAHEEVVEIYRRAERDRLRVARVHPGDPSLCGAVQDQYDACAWMDLEVEIVPGVPEFSAAAASVGRELATPRAAQSVLVTRLEGASSTMLGAEQVREYVRHGTTLALLVSAARTGQLVEELRAGGHTADVPVVVATKVSRPDELILRTTLGELEKTVKEYRLWRHTLFLVGHALGSGKRARPHQSRYRRGESSQHASSQVTNENGSSRGARAAGVRAAAEQAGTRTGQRVRLRREPSPDANMAWWAVRDWQETARNTPRVAASRTSVAAEQLAEGHPDLFRVDEPAEQQPEASAEEPAAEDAAESASEQTAPAPAKATKRTTATRKSPTTRAVASASGTKAAGTKSGGTKAKTTGSRNTTATGKPNTAAGKAKQAETSAGNTPTKRASGAKSGGKRQSDSGSGTRKNTPKRTESE